MRHLAGAWIVVLLAGLLPGGLAVAADDEIYHYRKPDGQRVYSDRKPPRGAYATIAKYGRPTATRSCMGLSAQALEARAQDYLPLIEKYASAHQVPASLVKAVMRVESCYDRRAVSKVGARGLMQLMPQTAKELGVSDSFDPEQNIDGGVRYLGKMLKRFDRSLQLALAAYNAGPEAVEKHRGVPPFPETENYVRRVLKLYGGTAPAAIKVGGERSTQ